MKRKPENKILNNQGCLKTWNLTIQDKKPEFEKF